MKYAAVLLAVCCALLGVNRGAEAAAAETLKREREGIEAEYARRAEACRGQFVVTPCLDRVRVEKQQALSGVSQQERALDAADRQARAEARKRRLAEKAPEASATPASSPASPHARPRHAPKSPKPQKLPKATRKVSPPQDRQAQEAASRAAFEARQREIEAHRTEVEKRNAERARNKPTPRPLPPPASSGS